MKVKYINDIDRGIIKSIDSEITSIIKDEKNVPIPTIYKIFSDIYLIID